MTRREVVNGWDMDDLSVGMSGITFELTKTYTWWYIRAN
jgi:hypothetical protein